MPPPYTDLYDRMSRCYWFDSNPNMFNRSMSFKLLFLKATSYINDAIIDKQSSIN